MLVDESLLAQSSHVVFRHLPFPDLVKGRSRQNSGMDTERVYVLSFVREVFDEFHGSDLRSVVR